MTRSRTARYKYRAEPTLEQSQWLAQAFGCARAAYNDVIWHREQERTTGAKPRPPLSAMAALPPEKAYLREVGSKVLQQAERQAATAYKNFFASLKGQRAGVCVGAPRYKRKKQGGSITWNGTSLQVRKLNARWAAVRLPKQGTWLKFRLSRALPSVPKSCTVILSPSGKYHVSFTVQQEVAEAKAPGSQPVAAGDMGLTDLLALVRSDGTREKVTNPRHLRRAERKLRRAQQKLSRCQKGSRNRDKARLRLAKAHEKVAATRLDHHRKLAHRLASENQAVTLESLSVSGMVRNRRLAKAISDASWASLRACVEQACEKLGASFSTCGRFAPTSQTCSVCGCLDGPKPLAVRQWRCEECGAFLDRDYNAAVNVLLAAGHAESLNACGGGVRLALAQAVASETGPPAAGFARRVA